MDELSPLRATARALRTRVESGSLLSMDEISAAAVTLSEAMRVFTEEPLDNDDGIFPKCCGQSCECSGGLLGGRATCTVCSAEIVDLLAPMDSPILKRGNSYLTMPGEELIKLFGERHWFVMHEGAR